MQEWLVGERDSCVKKLAKEKDPIEFYRIQGRLEMIDEILSIPEEIRKYHKDIESGKRQPLSAAVVPTERKMS